MQALPYMEGIQGIFVQTIAILPLDEVHNWQQHTDHCQAAKDALIADNLQRLNVQVGHEVVLKGDLSSLYTLHTNTNRLSPSCMQHLV